MKKALFLIVVSIILISCNSKNKNFIVLNEGEKVVDTTNGIYI